MNAVPKAEIPASSVPKEVLLSSKVPSVDRRNSDAYSTSFQRDFQHLPAKPSNKTSMHNEEYLTEAKASYQHPPFPRIIRIPHWTKLQTNFKMGADLRNVDFGTTHSQNFQLRPLQPPRTQIRPTLITKKIPHMEKLPESTFQASFVPHRDCPVVKSTVKHLEKGSPAVKGDGRHHSFATQYNNNFQGVWSGAAQSYKKHTSSVPMGNPEKLLERKTTHAASFIRPAVCRSPLSHVVKQSLKLNLGNFSKDSWSSTSKEDYRYHKLVDPDVLAKRSNTLSSFPKGDTDAQRNKDRMSVTISRLSFSDRSHTRHPMTVPGPDLMTKSNVQFSESSLSGLYYTTTAKEHYNKKDRAPAKASTLNPSYILRGPEHGPCLSTTMADFLPWKTCKPVMITYQPQHETHVRFPLVEQNFSTTSRDDYTAKSLRPVQSL
ncbi:uncharacterized protein si:dkey-13m1.5 [Mugil cephalus]|uniref:uncharacterized protein si:dkey-13m1.5 n=1 Tax=Mugil cephalus TaxID=48193 RepID=UPI001FB7D6E0|nr:uncharacterized protein si:dkey-13m1.5 [Mugil cephalus]